ncbi:MAG: ABC transporter permease [Acidobacteriota bacterium]
MKPAEALVMALENIAAHKLRSALTMLGIVFGVGAVIAMLSIGAGAERQALETISRLGLHNVVIRAKDLRDDVLKEVRVSSPGVSLRDAEAIRDAVPDVRTVAPKAEIEPWAVLSAGGSIEETTVEVYGVAEQHASLVNLDLAEGRFLDALDVREHAQVAVIGDRVRRDLFGYTEAVGEHVKVNDVWLEVIGVLSSTGAAAGGEVDAFEGVQLTSPATAIYLPISTVLRKFDRRPLESPLSEIVVRIEDGASSQRASAAIGSLLEQLHAGEEDYVLVVPEALLEESRRTQQLFNLVMGCIAGISLLVGGIGIMNIMLASVLERTREIGVRRAVGAKKRDIMVQFVFESFALSAIGGLAGIAMGVLIARVVAASAGWPTLVQAWSIVLATGVAVSVGLVSGIYPAYRAAHLDPIDSLRYE